MRFSDRLLFPALLVLIATAYDAVAQEAPAAGPSPQTVCGLPIPPPATEPPAGASPVIFQLVPCFSRQGNVSMVEPQTYLHYIHTRTSRPSVSEWVPYDEAAMTSILDDFKRIWATGFVDDLSIEAIDYPFANGTVGKLIVYNIDERQRIKIVTYEGAKHLEQSKLEEELRTRSLDIRLDSFVDHSRIAKIKSTIAEMLATEGFPDASVATRIEALPGGPKIIRLTFTITEGPKSQVRGIDFEGNQVFDDGTLRGAMGQNRLTRFVPFFKGGGTYKETAVEENAERVVQFYRNRGYVAARVGQPQLRPLEDSEDGRTRWLELHIPVTEGHRHRLGEFTVEGATAVKPEYLLSLFKIRKGDVYSEERIRDGLKKVHELYGALGRFEFTAYPDLSPRDTGEADHTVDVTLRLQEGELYLINRIDFLGNTSTKDNVIRRELRLYEGGAFNTEALKLSIRRLNQLGYFKPLEEQKNIQVEKTPGVPERVDLTLKVEEQNRNQISFGAGMSELNGLFINGSFSTTNFLGKGETVSIAVETGLRSNNYQASLTEPYVFNRPISIGASVFSRKTNYLLYSTEPSYSEVREGINGTIGMGLRAFTRIFGGYTYEVINAKSSEDFAAATSAATTATASTTSTNAATTTSATATNTATSTSTLTTRSPTPTFLYTLDQGRKVESRVEPAFVYDSVDNPFTPRSGMRLSLSSRVAGGPIGGEVNYFRPEAELIWYKPHTRRTALGLRAQVGLLRPYWGTTELPYYLRYFLGGENQIRGVDLRTVGPINSDNQLTGGNKFVLFNAEYYFDIAGPVRALAFHDAGQAFDETKRLNLRELRTSTGAELRVVVPMLNVPFRLIYAWNFYRDAFQPDRTFKFAVGTTF